MPARRLYGVLLACACAPAAGAADDIRLRIVAAGYDTDAPRSLQLEPIGLRDLGASPSTALGASGRDAHGSGGGIAAAGGTPPVPPLALRVRRPLPVRWQIDAPVEHRYAPPRVRVECETFDGRVGALALDAGTDLPVRVDTGVPRVIERSESRERYEGEVWIEFALDHVREAGRYDGRLVFTLEYF